MTPTSEERREVAAMIREDASCSENSPRFVVESYLGIEYDGTDALEESYKSESLLHLADLIDPKCRAVHQGTSMDDELVCSECGASLGVEADGERMFVPNFCSCCGSRVVSDDD